MSVDSQATRPYRILALAAIVHAALLLGVSIATDGNFSAGAPAARLWVGVVTLWFFWPIILALHPGSSAKRAYCTAAISAVLLLLPMFWYLRYEAGPVLGGDDIHSLSPYELAPYAASYAYGYAEATKRATDVFIRLKAYGMGGETPAVPPLDDITREKHRIAIDGIAGCGVTPSILGYARGYNTAAMREIKSRYGAGLINEARREETARQQRFSGMKNAGSAEAERDVRSGHLVILVHQAIEGEAEYRSLLGDRYRIELRRVSAEGDLDAWAHLHGYNEVSAAEIQRRFGREASTVAFCVTNGQSFEALLRRLEFDRSRSAETASR